MTHIHFIVDELPDGSFVARAVGHDIWTEANTLPQLHTMVREAVRCHFDGDQTPALIRLRITREVVLTT